MSERIKDNAAPMPRTGIAGVAAMIDGAQDFTDIDPITGEPLPDGWDHDEGDGQAVGEWIYGVPPDSPSMPLGRNKGMYYFQNSDGQLIGYTASQLNNAGNIMDLFDGNRDFALTYYKGERKNLSSDKARDALMSACQKRGIFNPENRMRGRGGWLGDERELIVHFGDEIWIETVNDEPGFRCDICQPGLISGNFYEADEPLMRPWDKPVSPDEIRPLLDRLMSWNWVRDYTGPRLFLGALAQAVVGGAFEWRSHVIVQGASGGGKSTLMSLAKLILGTAAIKVEDATEAALSGMLRHQTLPVIFDEFEAAEDNRKALAVINLMRRASHGGTRARGSSNHETHMGTSKSAFFASMITLPPMQTQDLNRILLLQLRAFEKGAKAWRPDGNEAEWKIMGRKLLRRMLDGWSAFEERKNIYRDRLAELGHDSRGQDTIGNLLACADVVLGDEPPCSDTIEEWTQGLAPQDMLEYIGANSDYDKVIARIMQSKPRSWANDIQGASIGDFVGSLKSGAKPDVDIIKKALNYAGLTITLRKKEAVWDLFIPNQHDQLRELFANTKFYGMPGTTGAWVYALQLGPRTHWREDTATVSGTKMRGIKIDIRTILGEAIDDAADEPMSDNGGETGTIEF